MRHALRSSLISAQVCCLQALLDLIFSSLLANRFAVSNIHQQSPSLEHHPRSLKYSDPEANSRFVRFLYYTLSTLSHDQMCFGSPPKGPPEVQAYRIHRQENSSNGYHDRRRSSVERHMAKAPSPIPLPKGRRYPKKHHNREQHYNTQTSLYEYPTMDFPYSQQNAKGNGRIPQPDGNILTISPGYTRTIIDRNKNIHGVSYHPHGDMEGYVRS